MRTRIKICGVTEPGIAAQAAVAGADAIGLVFHPPSSRYLELTQAAAVARAARAAGPFVAIVAVMVNPAADTVRAIVEKVAPSHLQFHGEEADDFCAGFGLPFIKALRVQPGTDARAAAAQYPSAHALLLDAHRPGVYGGSGKTFDWRRADVGDGGLPLILAGGLNVGNVRDAVAQVEPYAVDVSSGVEVAPGRKDALKIRMFCNAVAMADTLIANDQLVVDIAAAAQTP